MNEKRYIRFWLAFIVASMVIALMGCAPLAETVYYEQEPGIGLFTEHDTIVGNDTLYFWK